MDFKRILPTKILFVIILLSFSACAGVEGKPEDTTSVKIKRINERLVQSDVTASRPIWCGSGAFIYTTRDRGTKERSVFIYDVITEQKQKLGGRDYWPVTCTPDGEWIIYVDKASFKWVDEDDHAKGQNKELWRYEFASGRREQFLVMGSHEHLLSVEPENDGYRLYPGKKPLKQIEMREPKWDVVWSLDKRTYNELLFSDFSGVLGTYRDFDKKRYVLEVETFTPIRKIFTINPPYKSFPLKLSDGKNRIFVWVDDKKGYRNAIDRCDIDINKESVLCTTVLDLAGEFEPLSKKCPHCPRRTIGPSIYGLDIFKNDETLAYMAHSRSCLYIKQIGAKDSECLTATRYYSGGNVVISPGERWIAFTVARKIGESHGIASVEEDLYVIEIRKE